MGILVGINVMFNYCDLSFNLDFVNGKVGKFILFGIGVMSDIDFFGDEIDEVDFFVSLNEDVYVDF